MKLKLKEKLTKHYLKLKEKLKNLKLNKAKRKKIDIKTKDLIYLQELELKDDNEILLLYSNLKSAFERKKAILSMILATFILSIVTNSLNKIYDKIGKYISEFFTKSSDSKIELQNSNNIFTTFILILFVVIIFILLYLYIRGMFGIYRDFTIVEEIKQGRKNE